MSKRPLHNFHIPVMGIAFTIDTPIRVAQYGISSVISIIDDDIIEKMRKFYSKKFDLDFSAISVKVDDHRAKRITAYLNLVDDIVNQKFKAFKEDLVNRKQSLINFAEMLPNTSKIRSDLKKILSAGEITDSTLKHYLDHHLSPGSIDVNIMTKVDKDHYKDNEQLPIIYNDAHASLRGFAQSRLCSSIVLSAGMNPRLYSYIEQFEDFYPDSEHQLKKKIIIKVSDFRSAMIQGRFLAKKGLWVSEYRIESGLNCGGHAFATEGFLLGPILEEFRQRKNELIGNAHQLMIAALQNKSKPFPSEPFELRITVQGGVGTSEEHEFLLSHYKMDSVGWGSPFLLVPEATCVDLETRQLLANAKKHDFYLSDLSPLGILFNTVKGSSNEIIRETKLANNRSGSPCPKKFLALNKEFSSDGLCTASTKYQTLKFRQLEKEKTALISDQAQKQENKITEKACLCVGLSNSAYIENHIEVKGEDQGVVICPGPNLAYFDKEVTLSQMVKHIYGNGNVLSDAYRPNMFMNELKMYVDHMKKGLSESVHDMASANQKKWDTFRQNLLDGISYYENLFTNSSFPQHDILRDRNDLRSLKLSLGL
ncbi:hypothetical protein NG800_018060 [Epilithonimonas ginsengisoli]|uniref:Uncharacterized protein n=1 Tax=Epilithonimonas ginsengisoli TaxID=1245592 RepID=A0ABU4JME4_9FLAO|nr:MULTISPECIES: hypothetical protein [Chryseobacterium group]MBV6881781.1 hypothetical protein [Epilithonimonas sp. FP105]MDW8550837.1 hypothetical protein [Epilithonimonas ginsengisoli]OAH68512.1 hypothetical protein AXA65_17030 [Chryseobacterium sp. FP211-J200]